MDLRNLPEPVLRRLADHRGDRPNGQWRGVEAVQRGRVLEARVAKVELRRTESGNPILEGYATVYGFAYEVAGGPPWGWTETIAPGACTKSASERDDVRLLFDHEGIPLARTKSNTLALVSDDIGLRVATPAGIDMGSPHVQSLASALERGDLDEMSFAFQVLRQEWNGDYTERTVLEVKLFDVSVVTYPANPAAVAQLRAMPMPMPMGAEPDDPMSEDEDEGGAEAEATVTGDGNTTVAITVNVNLEPDDDELDPTLDPVGAAGARRIGLAYAKALALSSQF